LGVSVFAQGLVFGAETIKDGTVRFKEWPVGRGFEAPEK